MTIGKMIIIEIEIAIQIFLQSIKVNKKIINNGKINSANDKPSQVVLNARPLVFSKNLDIVVVAVSKIGVKFIMNPIIKLSDNAALRIKEIMSNAEKDSLGVRVSVKTGGCAGMSYVMEYTKEINPNDEVIDDKGVKVFVDSAAIMYLLGTEMDYKKEELSSSFVFNNPNETERCGCGESFKIE